MKLLNYILPSHHWLLSYNRKNLSGDLAAGLTVGVMLIPQGMAYAMIAGLPPVYGLYAAIIPQIIYAILGTSRQLSVAPVAMDSLLVAAGVATMASVESDQYIAIAILLAFMVGGIQMLLGVLRLGFITNLLSKPVITGFTAGAAVIIALTQLKPLLGIDLERSSKLYELIPQAIAQLSEIHWLTFVVGITSAVVIWSFNKTNRKLPGSLIAVIIGSLVVYFFQLEALGVSILKDVPGGLPPIKIPAFSLDLVIELLPLATTIAVVAFMEAFSVAKALESQQMDHKVIPNKELLALGASNLIGSFFQSYPVTGGFSRSAVNFQAGAKTQLSSVIAGALVTVTLLFLMPLFYYLPYAVLAGLILVAVTKLIDLRYTKYLYRTSKTEFALLVVTFLATLNLGMVPGIATGVVLSILMMLYRIAYPHIAVLGRLKGHHEFRNVNRFSDLERWEDILIVRPDAPLLFVNIQYLRDFIERKLNNDPRIRTLILDAAAIHHLDATALQGLTELIKLLKERGVRLLFAELVGPVRDSLRRSGFLKEIERDVFLDLNEAVNFVVKNEEPTHSREALQSN